MSVKVGHLGALYPLHLGATIDCEGIRWRSGLEIRERSRDRTRRGRQCPIGEREWLEIMRVQNPTDSHLSTFMNRRSDVSPGCNQERLASFKGKITRSYQECVEDWPMRPKSPAGAPNVLVLLLDDVGFGQVGGYGGLTHTPSIDRRAAGGLTYTSFHTPATASTTSTASPTPTPTTSSRSCTTTTRPRTHRSEIPTITSRPIWLTAPSTGSPPRSRLRRIARS